MSAPLRRPPVSSLWLRAQKALARDATAELSPGTALVLTPHPDDETIACGLLMAQKASAGIPVTVVLATDGRGGWYSSKPEPGPDEIAVARHDEWHRGLDALGVARDARVEFGFRDGGLEENEVELAARIGRVLEERRPQQVFVTSPDDLHADHRALGRATRQAVVDMFGFGRKDRAPAVFTYRVYPAAGMWPEGRPGETTPAMTAGQLVRALARLLADRAVEFRGPQGVAAKTEAIMAHGSQKKLLDGELRYVWGDDVELFRRLGAE